MAVKDVIDGHLGNCVVSGAFSDILVELYEFRMRATQDRHESTKFGNTSVYRTWYMGTPTVTVDLKGSYPAGVAYPKASTVAGRAAATMTLTTETGNTITLSGHVIKPHITVNRRTGLNDLTASFIGKITGSATA